MPDRSAKYTHVLGVVISVASCAQVLGTVVSETLPIVSATGGPIPVNYAQWNFQNWGDNLDTSSLTDGNASTGITLWGLDNVHQPYNSALIDTSAFALFKFIIPPNAPAIRFTVTDEAHGTSYLSEILIEVWRPDLDFWAQARFEDNAPVPTTYSVTFDPHGNDGTYSTSTDIWMSNLNNIQNSQHEVVFVIYGGTALDQPGQYSLSLYEVSATVVPEPSLMIPVLMLGIAVFNHQDSRRGRRR